MLVISKIISGRVRCGLLLAEKNFRFTLGGGGGGFEICFVFSLSCGDSVQYTTRYCIHYPHSYSTISGATQDIGGGGGLSNSNLRPGLGNIFLFTIYLQLRFIHYNEDQHILTKRDVTDIYIWPIFIRSR